MARKLEVELNAKSNADVVFGRAGRAANKFAGDVSARIMGAVAPMVLLDKGIGMITGSIDKYAEANIKARKLGVGFSDFYQLSQALEDTGVSEETTAKALKEMSIVLAEAQGGAQDQTKALQNLGYTQEQISKGSIDVIDLFMKLADATKSARSEAEKNNVVLSILGKKTGPELANALSMGATELKKNMGDASKATDDMGQRAEETKKYWRELGDDIDYAGMSVLKFFSNTITAVQRSKIMEDALKSVTESKLDDAEASKVMARALLQTGEAQGMSINQMKREIAAGGELNQWYDKTAGNVYAVGDNFKKGIELKTKTLEEARRMLDNKSKVGETPNKAEYLQFNATSMQALGGGYANARAGGNMNQPIGAMVGTKPLLPGVSSTRLSESEQIFSDIRDMVKTINGKIELPSSNQTNPHFRL